ncbi:SCO1664 family protein [Candidatus Leptofilum sp.]|uniref:SCO1664 family protein n=1 Tax=Candidatus Leptofilum sp. TaxID=3241576 RepID=UPI003B590165
MAQQTLSTADWLQLLQVGTLSVKGVLPWSSNYSFLVDVCPNTAVWEALPHLPQNSVKEVRAVYKPRRGERPLWDFAQGTLCQRERAAFLISHAIGWNLVPPTVLREGEHGTGSVQLFIDHNPEAHYFTFEGEPKFREALQKTVLLDIIINNADRKAGHVLIEEHENSDKLWLIDHGICFHAEYKLRTVIWEFAGEPIPLEMLSDLETLSDKIASNKAGLRSELTRLLAQTEVGALQNRIRRVINRGTFLAPGPGRHYPWPPV